MTNDASNPETKTPREIPYAELKELMRCLIALATIDDNGIHHERTKEAACLLEAAIDREISTVNAATFLDLLRLGANALKQEFDWEIPLEDQRRIRPSMELYSALMAKDPAAKARAERIRQKLR